MHALSIAILVSKRALHHVKLRISFNLKQMNDLSAEEVSAKFIENPYFQYFCSNAYLNIRLV